MFSVNACLWLGWLLKSNCTTVQLTIIALYSTFTHVNILSLTELSTKLVCMLTAWTETTNKNAIAS